jgi:diguanylate cyclase (GGDEF)-like protein/putative nucleotidyltransferase with HDIG domain
MSATAAPPSRVLAIVTPVCVAGVIATLAACVTFVRADHTTGELLSVAGLFVAMALVERFPVPVEGVDAGGVTLGLVLAIATIVLFGWQAGLIVAVGGTTVTHLLGHRPPLRVAYNGSMFAVAATVAGLAIQPIDGDSVWALIAQVALCAFLYNWVVNLTLISAVLSASTGKPFLHVVRDNWQQTTAPFALMSSAALMFVVMWQRSPALSIALVGPLLAIALYQRSTFAAMKAMRLALTDPLTGLGNHRHFHERLQRELASAEETGNKVALCLVDIDNFKSVNDHHGHPVGDRVLGQVASRLRQGGESFRLGGDEFAVLLPGLDERAALGVARSIVERVGAAQIEHVGSITVSAGVASFPVQGVGRDELIRLADSALYWAKEHGKNRVRVYRPDVVELAELKRLAAGPDKAARYRAAASLAKAVDARDTYTGSHSERVSELAARVAQRVGLDPEHVELTRLAGSLHDLGKLAIPEELLRKPGTLTDSERLVLERHPQIGFRMLDSLGVDPVADLVLHHHERWDGAGYPDGLSGEEIPLGARIIFVTDAYDAMTSDRIYRAKRSSEAALAELRRCAGTQFDPGIVAAFTEELGVSSSVEAATPALAS